ncbi:MAG: LIC_10190 family membrane protein [Dysgonomonas sp.]
MKRDFYIISIRLFTEQYGFTIYLMSFLYRKLYNLYFCLFYLWFMIYFIISWLIILFICTTFGNILIDIYDKVCDNKAYYNILDKLILGIGFIFIPLSVISFWFPLNHYVLSVFLLICVLYNVICKNKFKETYIGIFRNLRLLDIKQIITLGLSILTILIVIVWPSFQYDSIYYHWQQIMWNETYPVIPGLANLEDRFGFNSNYLLISSVFSLRFLTGNGVYALRSLMFLLMILWVLNNVFRSRYSVLSILCLLGLLFMFILCANELNDTSTDIIPNLCIFYIFIKTVLQKGWYKKANTAKHLFYP